MFCNTKPEFPESDNYVNYMNCKKVTRKYKTGPIENISIPFSVKQRNKKKARKKEMCITFKTPLLIILRWMLQGNSVPYLFVIVATFLFNKTTSINLVC